MQWKVLKTEAAYRKAIKRTLSIFQAKENTPEAHELALLLVLIKDYEDKNIPLPEIDPIEVIKLKMEERGIKPKDLEPIIGSKGHVSSVLAGRRDINIKDGAKTKRLFSIACRNISAFSLASQSQTSLIGIGSNPFVCLNIIISQKANMTQKLKGNSEERTRKIGMSKVCYSKIKSLPGIPDRKLLYR